MIKLLVFWPNLYETTQCLNVLKSFLSNILIQKTALFLKEKQLLLKMVVLLLFFLLVLLLLERRHYCFHFCVITFFQRPPVNYFHFTYEKNWKNIPKIVGFKHCQRYLQILLRQHFAVTFKVCRLKSPAASFWVQLFNITCIQIKLNIYISDRNCAKTPIGQCSELIVSHLRTTNLIKQAIF